LANRRGDIFFTIMGLKNKTFSLPACLGG